MKHLLLLAATAAVLAAAAVAATAFAQGEKGAAVNVTLREMAISVSPTNVPAGKVTFNARNKGTIEHEMVVVRAPRSGKLRIEHFEADEDGAVGEIEGVAPRGLRRTTMTLRRGRYLLICNIPGHYQLGMTAELVVGT